MSKHTLVERLRSRAWEDRQHRQLREEAAVVIGALLDALEAIVTADRDGELCHDQIAQAITAIAKARCVSDGLRRVGKVAA